MPRSCTVAVCHNQLWTTTSVYDWFSSISMHVNGQKAHGKGHLHISLFISQHHYCHEHAWSPYIARLSRTSYNVLCSATKVSVYFSCPIKQPGWPKKHITLSKWYRKRVAHTELQTYETDAQSFAWDNPGHSNCPLLPLVLKWKTTTKDSVC